ncbi:MAG TPA: hypothetical protein VKR29_13380 [Candidatus Binataceae bacterium]|nr:hypothetical protein [Candidatus Binataceae bacterium]
MSDPDPSKTLREVSARTATILLGLLGDTLALVGFLASVSFLTWLLEKWIKDPILLQAFTIAHEAGAILLFVLFLVLQVRNFWREGFHVFVLAA